MQTKIKEKNPSHKKTKSNNKAQMYFPKMVQSKTREYNVEYKPKVYSNIKYFKAKPHNIIQQDDGWMVI